MTPEPARSPCCRAHDGGRPGEAPLSPLDALAGLADRLEGDDPDRSPAWIVRAGRVAAGRRAKPPAGKSSAWPRWFPGMRPDSRAPLLYLLRSDAVAGVAAAVAEGVGQGIFCNDAEAFPSRWLKGVHPAMPTWLSTRFQGIPYDPASGPEILALLGSALEAAAGGDGGPRLFYMAVHGEPLAARPLSGADAADAFKGMYRVSAGSAGDPRPRVRLLGAGRALANVLEAADLLRSERAVDCEVWSCPSYTRLVRESDAIDCWNMLHPLAQRRSAHIERCLRGGHGPVIAVTGYAHPVAGQIRSCVGAPFVALGSDSMPGVAALPEARWIVAQALRALADEGATDAAVAAETMRLAIARRSAA